MTMKNQLHNIDKIILKNLEDHAIEPSNKVWAGLEDRFLDNWLQKGGFWSKNRILLIFMGITLVSLTAVLTLYTPSENLPIISSSDETINETTSDSHDEKTSDLFIQEEQTTLKSVASEIQNTKVVSAEVNANNAILISDRFGLQPSQPFVTNTFKGAFPFTMQSNGLANLSIDAQTIDLPPASFTNRPVPIPQPPDYYRTTEWFAGVNITPGITFYPENSGNRNQYLLELNTGYSRNSWFIQSGAGLGYYSEYGNTSIDYRSYDSVGYFYDVSSFQIHPEYPDSIIFNLKMTGIYDSIEHTVIKQTRNQYLYLQIPLSIGLRIWEKNRVSFTVRGGIIFSWLVYKDEPVVKFAPDDATLIKSNMLYPGRYTTNWQWTAGLGLRYQISNRLQFSIEPVFSQYFGNFYKTGKGYNKKMPYSIGLRTGIYLNY